MNRVRFVLTTGAAMSLAFPAPAHAVDLLGGEVPMLRLGVSLVGLLVAAVLLIEAGRVRSVALGGAIAEKIDNVILAILCLAASALARWTQNFVSGVTFEQVQIASESLVIMGMVLLGIYFASVRRALHRFLTSMTGSERLPDEVASDGLEPSETEGDALGA